MAERLTINPEQQEPLLPSGEHKRLPDHAKRAELENQSKHEQLRQLVEARQQANHEHAKATNPLEKLKAAEEVAPTQPQQINRELRQITLRRELQHIRRKLPAPQRAFSRVIHQPAVRVVSETAGKTVSRPSGLLGGGLVALLGTSSYLYLAKHQGFTYNYFVFLALFIGGFIIGLGLELAVHWSTASHRKIDS